MIRRQINSQHEIARVTRCGEHTKARRRLVDRALVDQAITGNFLRLTRFEPYNRHAGKQLLFERFREYVLLIVPAGPLHTPNDFLDAYSISRPTFMDKNKQASRRNDCQ